MSKDNAGSIRRIYFSVYIWSEAGGIEQVVASLACALKRRGVDAIVFGWRDTTAEEDQYCARLRQCKVRFISSNNFVGRLAWDWNYRIAVIERLADRLALLLWPLCLMRAWQTRGTWQQARASISGRIRRILLGLLSTYDLDAYMRLVIKLISLIWPPSIIHQQGKGSPALLDWANIHRIPTIYTEQNVPDESNFETDWRSMVSDLLRANCITAVSSGAADSLAHYLGISPAAIAVIPQPIEFPDRMRGHATNELKPAHKKPPRLIAMGRLHSMKGFDVLLNALPLLLEKGKEFELYLVGDGPERDSLVSLAHVNRLEGHVQFWGRQNHSDLPPLLEGSDILVCPSVKAEGLPLVAMEGMYYGLPLVVSDIVAFRDIVTHGENGLVTKAGDPHSLADALTYILDNPGEARRMGARSQERFRLGNFDADVICGRYFDVYRQAISGAVSYRSFRTASN